jgi:hypothetical protein
MTAVYALVNARNHFFAVSFKMKSAISRLFIAFAFITVFAGEFVFSFIYACLAIAMINNSRQSATSRHTDADDD